LGPTQPPIQWVPGNFPASKAAGRDNYPPASAEVKNARSYKSTHPYVFEVWYLVKKWVNFTFNFIFKIIGVHNIVDLR